MSYQVGQVYWFAVHPQSEMSPGCWENQKVGVPFEVVLDMQTPKVLTWVVKWSGVRFKQSTWPLKQLGVTRPPFKSKAEAQEYCDSNLARFDEDGNSQEKLSKSQQP